MIDSTSKILLTVSRGKSLVKAGVYSSADITVKDNKTIINKKMEVIQPPVYEECTQVVNLGSSFVKNCIERPERPKHPKAFKKWIFSKEGQLWKNWKHLSINQKIQFHVDQVSQAYGGTTKSWELM